MADSAASNAPRVLDGRTSCQPQRGHRGMTSGSVDSPELSGAGRIAAPGSDIPCPPKNSMAKDWSGSHPLGNG